MQAIFLRLDRVLSNFSYWQVMLLALLLLALLAAVDQKTGFEVSFSIFYLVPTALVTWYVNKRLGYVICVLAAIAWLTADFTSGHTYSKAWMPYWNASVRFMFFILVSYLIAAVRMHLEMEKLLARTDPLTSLKNLHSYREQVELLFKNASRHQFPITVGYIDLDGFKTVNDTRGHAEGDRVLKAVGSVLPLVAREGDVCARLGGDEFGVVLANTDIAGAEVFFERLHDRLLRVMKDGGWAVGFSIGVAVFKERFPTLEEAMNWADSLMYEVKRTGGNNVVCRKYTAAEASASQAGSPNVPNVLACYQFPRHLVKSDDVKRGDLWKERSSVASSSKRRLGRSKSTGYPAPRWPGTWGSGRTRSVAGYGKRVPIPRGLSPARAR